MIFRCRWGGDLAIEDNTPEAEELWFDFAEEEPKVLTSLTLDPQIVDTIDKLELLSQTLRNCPHPIAWDTESTSLNPHEAIVVGVGCCWGEKINQVAYIPLHHSQGNNLALEEFMKIMQPLLEDANSKKIMQNAKFDRLILRSIGIELQGLAFDTMLASYVLDPEAKHSLADLGVKYLQLACQSYNNLVGKLPSIAEVSITEVAHYCGTDAYFTYQLMPILMAELEKIPELKKLILLPRIAPRKNSSGHGMDGYPHRSGLFTATFSGTRPRPRKKLPSKLTKRSGGSLISIPPSNYPKF